MIRDLIVDGERPSLIFVNETYLVRHHLTGADIKLERALKLVDKTGADEVRARDDALYHARTSYKAALISLDAAEKMLPSKVRAIKGESFWDRFYRVSREREVEAQRSFVEPKA